MYRVLPAPLLGTLVLAVMTVSTVLHFIPILLLAIVKFVVPNTAWRDWWTKPLVAVAENWVRGNNLLFALALPTRFELRGFDDPRLQRRGRYLIASNHQTWSDVLVLQRALVDYAPFLRFFIKQELIWFPFLGFAWWALDMPFMKRYSSAFLAKNPHLRGKDIETTRRACERFRQGPISILAFVEGTRFTPEKRDRQESPYRYLLKPKAGGVAAVLDALSGDLDTLVDVTVVYGATNTDLWDLLSGGVPTVLCQAEVLPVPPDLRNGNYNEDEAYRERVQAWVRELWDRKDERIAALRLEV